MLKRSGFKPKKPICSYCGKAGHYSYQCYQRPNKPIKLEAAKTRKQRLMTRKTWFKKNPPNEDGYWDCYLRIAPNCLRRVTTYTIDLEHVEPKSKRPDLKYHIPNIKAACKPCNELKGSRTLEQLSVAYPHLLKLL